MRHYGRGGSHGLAVRDVLAAHDFKSRGGEGDVTGAARCRHQDLARGLKGEGAKPSPFFMSPAFYRQA